jgi:translation initiation factor IF-3
MSMIVARAPGWEPPKKQATSPEKPRSNTTANGKATNTQNTADSSTPPKPALVAENNEEAANSQAEG